MICTEYDRYKRASIVLYCDRPACDARLVAGPKVPLPAFRRGAAAWLFVVRSGAVRHYCPRCRVAAAGGGK